MPNTMGVPVDVEVVIKESQSQILANLKIAGVSNEDAAKQLNISLYRVRKLQEHEDFKQHLRERAEHVMQVATDTWKAMMKDLVPLAYEALIKALKRGDLKGVEIMIKTLGIDKQQSQVNSGNIQIVLPDYAQSKIKEVFNE